MPEGDYQAIVDSLRSEGNYRVNELVRTKQ
jgi:hypothetical protein